MRRLLVWGIGEVYNRYLNLLKYFERLGSIEIAALTAKDIPTQIKRLDDYPLVNVREISSLSYDYIMVMSVKYYWEIFHEIVDRGISSDKIIPCKILQIPDLDMDDYFYIKESKLSIVANNCWGGVVYNTLGLECLSPFKNLFILDEDYIKLLGNLKYYLSIKPKAAGWDCLHENKRYEVERYENSRYPVIALDDIMLRCNHMKDHETALEEWNSRRKRFNFDNIFVEMGTNHKHIAEKYQEINIFDKKVCFVPWETNEKGYIHLEPTMNETRIGPIANYHARLNGYNQLNLLRLLCMKDCIRWR